MTRPAATMMRGSAATAVLVVAAVQRAAGQVTVTIVLLEVHNQNLNCTSISTDGRHTESVPALGLIHIELIRT